MSDLSERKELRLRRDDHCRTCSGEVRRGERALWEKSTRSVICLPCGLVSGAAPARPDSGIAGQSARRMHQKRRTPSWGKGAKGEELVGKRLERLLEGSGVLLLHDRRIPRSRANIDHIAVGPGGVTVIDTKNYTGKVRVERRGGLLSPSREDLRIKGRRRTTLVEGVNRQIDVVRETLSAARVGQIEISGALCFANPHGLPCLRSQYLFGVLIDGPKRTAKLAKRAGDLSGERVAAIHRELSVRLPPA